MKVTGYGLDPMTLARPALRRGPSSPALPPVSQPPAADKSRPTSGGAGSTFRQLLRQVVDADAKAEQAAQSYAAGRNEDLHETMVLLQKADISFSLLLSVRNKLLDAYREVMRMS